MEQTLILLITTVILFGAPGISENLSFESKKEFKITRMGCRDTKLCVETPDNCDPAGSSACLFVSVKAGTQMPPTGPEMTFELSGNSSGFIALGLTSPSKGNTMLYACAKNISGSFFQYAKLDIKDNNITPSEKTVTEVRGKVNGDMIQCEFKVPNLNASSTSSTQDTTFDLRLGSGDVNGETLVNFTTSLTFKALNLSDPTSNAVTTTGASCAVLSHAVRFLLSMLSLSILKIA